MKLQNRIQLLERLGEYLLSSDPRLMEAKQAAGVENGWFIPEFINASLNNISNYFLKKDLLEKWVAHYHLDDNIQPQLVGIVMAGNIPLVGFHDLLCVFVAGHRARIKVSSKDTVLMKHIVSMLQEWEPSTIPLIEIAPMLQGCDAYIATGSNNSARYFEYYFSKYPSIIRRNRTSVAILTGEEKQADLVKLADDIHLYFGLGCRNVTKIFVPEEYDFVPLIQAFKAYDYFADHHKYKNNYDYNLSIHLLNGKYYMSSAATLIIEHESLFSPISQLNYSFYKEYRPLLDSLLGSTDIQCIAGVQAPFGSTQTPGLMDYADGVDTMQFLVGIG